MISAGVNFSDTFFRLDDTSTFLNNLPEAVAADASLFTFG